MNYLENLDELLKKLELKKDFTKVAEDIYLLKPQTVRERAPTIALTAITHGDEIIGLALFIKLLEDYLDGKLTILGPIYFIIANRAAYFKQQRYIEADLNRLYGNSTEKTLESRRAEVIKPIIDLCDYSIDIHQCIEDTLTPFFILPYSEDNIDWINQVVPEIPFVIRKELKAATTLSSYAFL